MLRTPPYCHETLGIWNYQYTRDLFVCRVQRGSGCCRYIAWKSGVVSYLIEWIETTSCSALHGVYFGGALLRSSCRCHLAGRRELARKRKVLPIFGGHGAGYGALIRRKPFKLPAFGLRETRDARPMAGGTE